VSITDWAWFAVAIALIILVAVVCVVMANLFRLLTRVADLVDGVTKETVPLLSDVDDTVKLVNHELGRVDGILATAEQISQTTGHVVNVVSETVTSPLVRLSAFAYGLRKAVGASADGEGDGEGGRRRSRRRRRPWGRRR
jgi:predicted PurR-regulated permease PerM